MANIAGVPAAQLVLGYSAAAAMLAFGLWLARSANPRPSNGENPPQRRGIAGWRDSLTDPTRVTVGLCLMVLGYHIAAYAGPAQWLSLCVPRDRWWILAAGVATAIGASLLSDRLSGERR